MSRRESEQPTGWITRSSTQPVSPKPAKDSAHQTWAKDRYPEAHAANDDRALLGEPTDKANKTKPPVIESGLTTDQWEQLVKARLLAAARNEKNQLG